MIEQLIIISSIIGVFIWVCGFVFLLYAISEHFVSLGVAGFLLALLIGNLLLIPGEFIPIRNVRVEIKQPTYIFKTNNITSINFIENGKQSSWIMTDASFWNSTNIFIERKIGNNFLGKKDIATVWKLKCE